MFSVPSKLTGKEMTPRAAGTMPFSPAKSVMAHHKRILIVDHLAIQRSALRYLLQDEYALAFAQDAQEATELVRAGWPDLIVMDHFLPYLDGWEVSRAVRQQGYMGPIIMTTAFPTPEDHQAAEHSYALDYIAKPLDVFGFEALIRRRIHEPAQGFTPQSAAKSCG